MNSREQLVNHSNEPTSAKKMTQSYLENKFSGLRPLLAMGNDGKKLVTHGCNIPFSWLSL